MNAVPASIKAASEPQVNLLPPEVEARRARGRQKGFIAFAFVAFLAVLGFAVYWFSAQEAAAQEELTKAVKEGEALQAQIDDYQYVVDLEAELQNARNARTYVGSTEFAFARIISDVNNALPTGTRIETMSWKITSIATDTPEALDPLAVPDIGEVVIRGVMTTYVTGAALEEALNSVPGLARARIVSEQRQEGEGGSVTYVFEGSARVTALAFSGRFGSVWLEVDMVYRAVNAVEERLAEASDALEAAREVGTAEALSEAQAAYDLAKADSGQVLALYQFALDLEEEIASLQEAAAYGVAGTDEALLMAIAEYDEARQVLGVLAAAVNAWDEEAGNVTTVEARIAAAEAYVTRCEEGVTAAEAAVAAGEEGADEALAEVETMLMKAEYGLAIEQSFLVAAEEAEAATREALDGALLTAAALAPVDESAGGDES
ncbi:MAG: hypothetical protein JW722_05090 [Demequinaceae bacterium]|nr:hypothetical protein [Demequinaceae bacterium]